MFATFTYLFTVSIKSAAENFKVFKMSIFASIHWLIWISFESIKCLKGSPVSLAVVNRDTNLNLDYSEEITTETTTENLNPDDITLRSGPHEPEEENRDTSKTIIIVVGVMIVFILLTIFNHVIVPKVNGSNKNKFHVHQCQAQIKI